MVKRKVKYPRLELKTGELLVVIPHSGDFHVPEFVMKHQAWIDNKYNLIRKYSQKKVNLREKPLTKEDLKKIIIALTEKYEAIIRAKPRRIIIKEMKSKWGSCSSAKNLCFNLLLSKLPDGIIRYVVYHEMCHLKNRRHDDNFQFLLKKRYKHPDRMEKKLFSYWFAVNRQ